MWVTRADEPGEIRTADGVTPGHWAVSTQGIYWVTAGGAVEFSSFDASHPLQVASVSPDIARYWDPPGLSVSPDGRWLVYAMRERGESDIVLVENFR